MISRAILAYNRGRSEHLADGIVVTPSHNPPADGGFKYNPPNGGPADTEVTGRVQDRANELLRSGCAGVKRLSLERAMRATTTREEDLVLPYVNDLRNVVDMDAIRGAGLALAVDPLGGSAVHYWEPINSVYGLDIEVVNPSVDPTFSFMTVDHDGAIRMDCSSPYAMARLVGLKDRYRVAFANDPDADRHGIVTPSAGLMNPNHYLAVAIHYLLTHRPDWPADAVVGKTLVSSSMLDRVVGDLGRRLWEVPVGFKWFVPGLFDGSCCFGGEESAGASFLRLDGSVWTTDKDGPIMDLLAAEITARTGRDPGEHYQALTSRFGAPSYVRIDAPATPDAEGEARQAVAGGRPGLEPGGRGDHGPAHPGAGQRRPDRRPEGDDGERLVRGASLRHREHLQDLRGELPGRRARRGDPARRAGDRGRGAGRAGVVAVASVPIPLPARAPRMGSRRRGPPSRRHDRRRPGRRPR